jgi:hypothetical protein
MKRLSKDQHSRSRDSRPTKYETGLLFTQQGHLAFYS